MAKVIKFTGGDTHLMSGTLTTLDSLCGICQENDNRPVGEEFEGKLTCPACIETAMVVFHSCKKSEVK